MFGAMRWRFGDHVLDDERFRLTRAGQPVPLRRKVFDLLVLLVRERERVVLREELVERLWSTTTVGPGSLSGLVNELRAALDEAGRGASAIRTVHARGYQFVAPVELEPAPGASDAPVFPGRLRRTARARLERAGVEVHRSGARALVIAIADSAARASWLATMLGEARAVGFEARCERVAGAHRAEPPGPALDPSVGLAAEVAPTAWPAADRLRAPIALGLEVDEPGRWAQAGGLPRLLDLLGRAPVLVLAALAGDPADAGGAWLRDARIERAAIPDAGEAPGGAGGAGEGDDGPVRARVAGILRALAGEDEAAFLAAIRGMGFELASPEPIRSLRRVGPASAGIERRERAQRS